ncbi:MAG: alpha/beta fold hydrolase [Capsulimonadaceae bacterium]|nr:alpha/beta fold hydrolase [Capsulimonadaceae bacterium]
MRHAKYDPLFPVIALMLMLTASRPAVARSENIAFPGGAGGVTLAGTLTEPRGSGPFPAIVLVPGSGHYDRDETILGHKPFLVIASTLTRRGFVVLRYDKRGNHRSTGSYARATTDDFASDALAAVRFLETRRDVNRSRIGILGQSEGGLVASICAARNARIAFIVLLGSPGLPGDKVLIWQTQALGDLAGEPPGMIAEGQDLIRCAATIYSWPIARPDVSACLWAHAATSAQEFRRSPQVAAWIKMLSSPWYRCFLTCDPATSLRRVRCPVLALAGSLDKQVPPREDLDAIAAALKAAGNTDVTVALMPGLNHFLQPAKTGGTDEYGKIATTIDPVALAKIGEWLEAHGR